MLAMKERPQRKIYPFGYGMDGAQQYIDQLMAQPQMLLIDTRFSPKSRWASGGKACYEKIRPSLSEAGE